MFRNNSFQSMEKEYTYIFKNYPGIEIFDISGKLKEEKSRCCTIARVTTDHPADGGRELPPAFPECKARTKTLLNVRALYPVININSRGKRVLTMNHVSLRVVVSGILEPVRQGRTWGCVAWQLAEENGFLGLLKGCHLKER